MSLAERLLQWPQTVARQVFTAVMVPAADMHPAQARQAVPQALWAVSPVHLSKALSQGTPADWHSAIDGRQISHRLALLPTAVVAQVAWNLGLLMHARNLRQVVMREDVQALADAGIDEAAWQWVLQPLKPHQLLAADGRLASLPLAQWPQWLRERGEDALLALTGSLMPALAQRLRWKLGAQEPSAAGLPNPELIELAYGEAAAGWSADWDRCLAQLKPIR
jgi:hypothetical protein